MAALLVAVGRTSAEQTLGDYTHHRTLPNGVEVFAGESGLRLRWYRECLLRVDFLPDSLVTHDSSLVVIQPPLATAGITVEDQGYRLRIGGLDPVLYLVKEPLRLQVELPGGELLAEPEEIGFGWEEGQRRSRFVLGDDWRLYGTGERGIGPELRGWAFECRNTQVFGYDGPLETMNINVPLVLSTGGAALYFENTRPGHFDLGSTDADRMIYTVPEGELSVYVITGDGLPVQLEAYAWLSGRPPMPPRWALGYLQSKYGYRNEDEARAAVEGFRQRGWPLDALILDLYWFEHMGDLAWNHSAWPDPSGMMEDFLEQGVRTVLITEPYVTQFSQLYDVLVGSMPSYLGHDEQGDPWILPDWWSCACDAVLFDMSHPEAAAWWWERHVPLFDSPLAGLWTDLGEPERHPEGMLHHLGAADKVHNVYNLLWSAALAEGFRQARPNERLFMLSRSGYAGSQRHGVFTWSGDVSRTWGGLAVQVPIMLGAGLSGLPYHGSDLGGFWGGPTSPELYVRWFQQGALAPAMRAHGLDDQATEPWGFGETAEQICGEMLKLRNRLLPHLYSLAREAHECGLPPARPLFFADPEDQALYDENDAWLLGEDLLVAPVLWEGETQRAIRLPQGAWIDYWTGERHAGGQQADLAAPLERLPLLVREGAILPTQPAMEYAGQFPPDTLILDLYHSPDRSAGYDLYEDDGLSLDYLADQYARTELSLNWQADDDSTGSLVLQAASPVGSYTGMPDERVLRLRVNRVFQAPEEVLVNGIPALELADLDALYHAEMAWVHEPGAARLWVQHAAPASTPRQVEISGLPADTGVAGRLEQPRQLRIVGIRPNPSNGLARIQYFLRRPQHLSIELYNLLGRRVRTLKEGSQPAGEHILALHTGALASGIYLVHITGDESSCTAKLAVIR